MARRGSSARAAALRRAQQAKATRDAARLRREKDIEAALADYFEATDQAERLRAEARRKADRLLTDAELAAETPRQAASAAVHRLRALVGTATEVASLCGISAGRGPGRARQAGTSFAASRGGRSARPAPIRNPVTSSAAPDSRPRRGTGDPARRRTWPPIPVRRQPQRGMTSVGEEREPTSWLTGEVRMDPFLLQDAHRVYADRGGREDGYLAARRLLDERLRRMVHWPTGQEYARLAEDLDADGRWADAALLRQIAATDGLLTEAQTRWNTRYAARPETGGERDTRRLIDAGLIDFDPDGPYPGIDGSNCTGPATPAWKPARGKHPSSWCPGAGLLATGHRIRRPGSGRAVAARPRPDGQRAAHRAGRAVAAASRPGRAHPGARAVPPRRPARLAGRTAAHHLHRGRTLRHLRRHHHRGRHGTAVGPRARRRRARPPDGLGPRLGPAPPRWPGHPLATGLPAPPGQHRTAELRGTAPARRRHPGPARVRSAGSWDAATGRGGKTHLGDAGKRPVAPSTPPRLRRMRSRRPGARRSGPGQRARRLGCEHAIGSVIDRRAEGNQHELARRISAPTARSGDGAGRQIRRPVPSDRRRSPHRKQRETTPARAAVTQIQTRPSTRRWL